MENKKKVPINTRREVSENPMGFMLDAMVSGGSNAIPNQEAQGQRSFVNSTTLPTNMGYSRDYDTKAILEAAGVKFLGVVEGDEMFQQVELPDGWKKAATDHSMWSKLVDDKGRERAMIFYKAAFYDRSAHISLSRRYGVSFDYDRFDKESVGVVNVTDGDNVIYSTEPIQANGRERERYDVSDEANKPAIEWLDKNYPDWQSPAAYWD